jgi:hypothetical protein
MLILQPSWSSYWRLDELWFESHRVYCTESVQHGENDFGSYVAFRFGISLSMFVTTSLLLNCARYSFRQWAVYSARSG